MSYNEIEREAVGLCVCLEAINNIVNHALLDIRSSSKYPNESMVYFNSSAQKDLFLIRFLDFSKEAGNAQLTGTSGSCLVILTLICDSPAIGSVDYAKDLRAAVFELNEWLNFKSSMKLWLPTLDINAELEVSRLEFLTISGNQSKHNLSRLMGVSKLIQNILDRNGYEVAIDHIPLALDDFHEHLQENYFIYHGTWITELLNNIRWSIQTYLAPIYTKCYIKGMDLSYGYSYPDQLKNEIARMWFWRLMNNVRSGPYIKKFKSPEGFRSQSSLEWY
jgi:hypothetical protein